MNENKKISFGFSKLTKKTNILPKTEKSVELIECLEGSEIKLVNPVEVEEKKPLVIELKGNANNIIERIERESRKNKQIKTEKNDEDTRPDSELTVEELAARQLLREARNRLAIEKDTTKIHTLPLTDEKIGALDAEEPSIDDYENVPISDYGLAMLRGMGWKEGMSIGKNQSNAVKPLEPELRPKGLGLGAQKIVDVNPKEVIDKNGKELILAKGAFAKITAGSHKGKYCEVQGLDDDSGRINVLINKNETLTLNELFVTPVTKEEYSLGSKILNNAKYEQYKEQTKRNDKESYSKREDYEKTSHHSRDKKYLIKEKKYSSDESFSGNSKKKSKRRDSSNSSLSENEFRRNRSKRDSSPNDSDRTKRSHHKKHKKSKHRTKDYKNKR